jgi:hypothetical protein
MKEIEMSEKTRQARDRLRESLKANPDIARAFKETIEEMRKPENVQKDAAAILKVMNAVCALQEAVRQNKGR